MIIKKEIESLEEFEFWGGAVSRYNEIIELDMEDEVFSIIEECYPDGLTDTQLNDCIWFDFDDMIEEMKESIELEK